MSGIVNLRIRKSWIFGIKNQGFTCYWESWDFHIRNLVKQKSGAPYTVRLLFISITVPSDIQGTCFSLVSMMDKRAFSWNSAGRNRVVGGRSECQHDVWAWIWWCLSCMFFWFPLPLFPESWVLRFFDTHYSYFWLSLFSHHLHTTYRFMTIFVLHVCCGLIGTDIMGNLQSLLAGFFSALSWVYMTAVQILFCILLFSTKPGIHQWFLSVNYNPNSWLSLPAALR